MPKTFGTPPEALAEADESSQVNEPRAKKSRKTKKREYLGSLGIVRPPTDFQLWGESIKEQLRSDIESGQPPAEREAAYRASINEKGKCNLNTYRGKLWRPVDQGGFGYVTPEEREHWQNVYKENRIEWKARQDAAMEDYPKRPPTPYFCFYEKDFIGAYLAKHPDTPLPDIARAASKEWAEKKDTEEFKQYYEEAERMKDVYLAKKAAYEAKMTAENPDWNKPAPKKIKKQAAPKKEAAGPKKAIAKKSVDKKAIAKKGAKKQLAATAKALQTKAGAKRQPAKTAKSVKDKVDAAIPMEE